MTTVVIRGIFDALAVLGDGYDLSTVTAIEVAEGVKLTDDQAATLKRLRARIRKRLSRAGKREVLLPLPVGTAQAMERVMAASDFDDPRDFMAFWIHRLDDLLQTQGELFNTDARRLVRVGDLSHYHDRIGAPVREDDENDGDDDSALREAESLQD